MFNGTNVEVNGGLFYNITGQATIHPGNTAAKNVQKDLESLEAHCSFGSLLDSNERFDAPKCAEHTRDAIIHGIMEWINSAGSNAQLFWLFGPAGAGKSALAQTIAELCQQQGKLAASFFFSRTSTSLDRSDGDKLVPTLIFQIMKALPDIRGHVKWAIKEQPDLLHKSRKIQMERLFLEPINKLTFLNFLRRLGWWTFPRLIVVDGLDECRDPKVQCDLLRILALTVDRLGLPFRILITSRPEAHIVSTFKEKCFQQSPIRTEDLSGDIDVKHDLRIFLVKSFEDIRQKHPLGDRLNTLWPGEEDITFLVNKSTPQFIYAATVLKYIASPDDRPDHRLRVILRALATPVDDKPYADLDALYTYIFLCIPERKRKTVYAILGLLHLSTQSHSKFCGNSSTADIERVLFLEPGDVKLALRPLYSLLEVSDNEHQPVKIFHASLFDFLLDITRSAQLLFNMKDAFRFIGKQRMKALGDVLGDTDHDERIVVTLLAEFLECWAGFEPLPPDSVTGQKGFRAICKEFGFLDIPQIRFHMMLLWQLLPSSDPALSQVEPFLHYVSGSSGMSEAAQSFVIKCSCIVQSDSDIPSPPLPPSPGYSRFVTGLHLRSLSFRRVYEWSGLTPFFQSVCLRILSSRTLEELDISKIKGFPASSLSQSWDTIRVLSVSTLTFNLDRDVFIAQLSIQPSISIPLREFTLEVLPKTSGTIPSQEDLALIYHHFKISRLTLRMRSYEPWFTYIDILFPRITKLTMDISVDFQVFEIVSSVLERMESSRITFKRFELLLRSPDSEISSRRGIEIPGPQGHRLLSELENLTYYLSKTYFKNLEGTSLTTKNLLRPIWNSEFNSWLTTTEFKSHSGLISL